MRRVKGVWKSGIILVCTNERPPELNRVSCGNARGTELRQWLKERIRAEGLEDDLLSVKSSCLGICSALGVTVEVVPAGGQPMTLVVDPEHDREELWRVVRSHLVEEA
jgi:hypothetical protein